MSAEAPEPIPETLEDVIKERDSLQNRLTITQQVLAEYRAAKREREKAEDLAVPRFILVEAAKTAQYWDSDRTQKDLKPRVHSNGEIQIRWETPHAWGHTQHMLWLPKDRRLALATWLMKLELWGQ
jgi:hypothetical protein